MKANCSGCFICLVFLFAAGVGRAASPTLTELHGFNGADGYLPAAPLLEASDGNFYGTTFDGGNDGSGCVQGCDGTVFKITAQGQLTLLHTFVGGGTNPPYQNGRNPWGGLVEGPDGYLYGTTFNGGYPFSHGIVYKISKTGQFQKLHDFCNTTPCSDGTNPQGSLALGNDGFFYGTLTSPPAFPKAFRVSSTGSYQVIAEFYNSGLGTPANGLVQASDGNFYGVAVGGVYRVTPGGQLTALYFFKAADGSGNDALIQAADGNLYGATYPGPGNSGVVFRMSLTGTFQKILDLSASSTGTVPNALVQASDGHLWGTANAGGTSAGGTVYTIATDGTLLQTLSLSMNSTGIKPLAPLIQGTDGKLYATTSEYGVLPDGSPANGTVFVVDAGLSTRVIGLTGNLVFGNTYVGTVSAGLLTITNRGNSALTVSSILYPAGFSSDWAGGTISAGGFQTVTVSFAPTAQSNYGGTITVNGDQTSGTNTVAASGAGVIFNGSGEPNGTGGGSAPGS